VPAVPLALVLPAVVPVALVLLDLVLVALVLVWSSGPVLTDAPP
jgi:hypothetical protein